MRLWMDASFLCHSHRNAVKYILIPVVNAGVIFILFPYLWITTIWLSTVTAVPIPMQLSNIESKFYI